MEKNSKNPLSEKTRLFHRLNEEFSRFDKTLGEYVRCPLCWNRFNMKSLESELTNEHVAPLTTAKLIKETTYKTLTCKNCNNTYGSQYHSHLKKFLIFQLHQAGKYNGPIKGKISIPNTKAIPLRSNISLGTENDKLGIKIVGVPKANAPFVTQNHISTLNEITDKNFRDFSFNVTLEYECIPSIAWSAYLQVAYLMAGIVTHSEYNFSKAGVEVRNILKNGRADEIEACIIAPKIIGVGGKPWIARIDAPVNLRCLWVKVAGNIVVLPLPEDMNMSCYQQWQQISEKTVFGINPPKMPMKITFFSKEDASNALKLGNFSL